MIGQGDRASRYVREIVAAATTRDGRYDGSAPVHRVGALDETECSGELSRVLGVLGCRGVRSELVRVVLRGTSVPPRLYTTTATMGTATVTDAIDIASLDRLFSSGATVICDGLDLYDDLFANVHAEFAALSRSSVSVSAYLSPPNTRGLDLHIDEEDVFVLQIGGSKHWTVFEPVDTEFRHGRAVAESKVTGPLIDAEVRAGDVVFIPRGCPHRAAAGGRGSVHITIGIERAMLAEQLGAAVAAYAADAGLADRPAPSWLFDEPDPNAFSHASLPEIWARHLDSYPGPVTFQSLRRAAEARFHTRIELLMGPVDDDDIVHLLDGVEAWTDSDGRIVVRNASARIRLPDRAGEVVTRLRRGDEVRVGDLQSSTGSGRELVDQLIWYRFVSVARVRCVDSVGTGSAISCR